MSEINLRAERLDRGLSVRQAAKQMKLGTPQVLLNAETGKTVPRPDTAFKIASFYGYKVTEVWPLDEERQAA